MRLAAPQDVAEKLAAAAPDRAWLRSLTDELYRRLELDPLDRFTTVWNLSDSEAAQAFGVSRQAFSKWRREGVPAERTPALAELDAATDILERRVKRERIPGVVRRPAEMLGGRSLLEMARSGEHAEVHRAVATMLDLRRVQP
jgi:hypothetical protein